MGSMITCPTSITSTVNPLVSPQPRTEIRPHFMTKEFLKNHEILFLPRCLYTTQHSPCARATGAVHVFTGRPLITSAFLYLLTIRGVESLPVDRLRFPDVLFTLSYQQRVTHMTIMEVLQQHTLHTHARTQGLAHTNVRTFSSIERMKNNLWLLTSTS